MEQAMSNHTLTEQDLIDKLEEIASDDRNRAAQIAAIKELRAIQRGGKADEDDKPAGLYEVSNPGRIRKAA
jgi:hypothetical protein